MALGLGVQLPRLEPAGERKQGKRNRDRGREEKPVGEKHVALADLTYMQSIRFANSISMPGCR
jgi:hypothetical protein